LHVDSRRVHIVDATLTDILDPLAQQPRSLAGATVKAPKTVEPRIVNRSVPQYLDKPAHQLGWAERLLRRNPQITSITARAKGIVHWIHVSGSSQLDEPLCGPGVIAIFSADH